VVYGNIDSAEQSARQNINSFYDRRGTVIWFDGFEAANDNHWSLGGDAGGTKALTTTKAWMGNQSMLMTTPGVAGQFANLNKAFSAPFNYRMGAEVMMREGDNDPRVSLLILGYSGTYVYRGTLRFNFATDVLDYRNSAGGYTALTVVDSYNTDQEQWIPIKLVVDWTTGYYVRAFFGGTEYDLSTIPLYATASAILPRVHCQIYTEATLAAASTMYYDNFIFTQNE